MLQKVQVLIHLNDRNLVKHDLFFNLGDRLGYLTLWDLSTFLQEHGDSIKQIISWRAHTSKVASLVIPNTQKLTIYSASTDGSVR